MCRTVSVNESTSVVSQLSVQKVRTSLIGVILYSGKFSSEKTFVHFAVLWLFAKLGAWHPLVWQKRAIRKSFLRENCLFHQFVKVFSLKFPTIRYQNSRLFSGGAKFRVSKLFHLQNIPLWMACTVASYPGCWCMRKGEPGLIFCKSWEIENYHVIFIVQSWQKRNSLQNRFCNIV